MDLLPTRALFNLNRPVSNHNLISLKPDIKALRRCRCLVCFQTTPVALMFLFCDTNNMMPNQRLKGKCAAIFPIDFYWVERYGSLYYLDRASLHLCKDKACKAATTCRLPADPAVQSSCRLMLLQVLIQRMSRLSKHAFPLFLPPHIFSFNLFLISYIREAQIQGKDTNETSD